MIQMFLIVWVIAFFVFIIFKTDYKNAMIASFPVAIYFLIGAYHFDLLTHFNI